MSVRYLEKFQHVKADKRSMQKVTRIELEWATIGNIVDCGVFAMRHMEMFMGSNRKNFDCGFKASEKQPPDNVYSFNELVSLWEKKIGKILEKVYLSEDQVLRKIQEYPIPLNTMLSIGHSVFVKGDQTNFEIEPSFGVEASALYPDVKHTTVDEYLSRFV
ncbi:hypothetical protein R6Q57_006351 [Mikania cordata]